MNKILVWFLESHELLPDMQYGFRHSRSTGDLLSYVTVISQQLQQLCDAFNKDLQTISEWGSQWLVAFNSSKTQSVLHSRLKDDGAPCNLQMSRSIPQEG